MVSNEVFTEEITISVIGPGEESKGAKVDTEKTGEVWKGTYKGNVV